MKNLSQRLFLLVFAVLAVIGLTWTTPVPGESVVEAAGTDCQVVSQVCHDINAGLYALCVNQTGDYTGCAATEAENNISCITGAGCPYNN